MAKSNPHTSQNFPLRAVPHCGHGSAGSGWPTGLAVTAGLAVTVGPAGPAVRAVPGGAPSIRIPHVSQKSVAADSWPAGQTAIAIPAISWF
jgi:hypothetical protein